MPDVKRELRLVTEQRANPAKGEGQPGYPMRDWSVAIYVVNQHDGSLAPANMYEKVTYKLHETFKKATQSFREPPFKIVEEGWGEFDMAIQLTQLGRAGEHDLAHDLNFQNERYEATHKVVFKNPKPEMLAILRESGPVPGDENGAKAGAGGGSSKRKSAGGAGARRGAGSVDMEKLAEGLQRLGEDDLLSVVQMVHDNKTSDTYTKNDVENGEFHVDLYTLPDPLVKMLWDFTAQRTDMA